MEPTLTILGPEPLELRRGESLELKTVAISTNGREVKNADVRPDVLAEIAVDGMTLTALPVSDAPAGEHVVEVTWHRSDGARPKARKRIRILEAGEDPGPGDPGPGDPGPGDPGPEDPGPEDPGPEDPGPEPTPVLEARIDIVSIEGRTVTVDRRNSTRPEANGLATEWDFGDGTMPKTRAVESHTYPAAGEYTITLTIEHRDYPGISSSATAVVTVGAGGPDPVPDPDPDPGPGPDPEEPPPDSTNPDILEARFTLVVHDNGRTITVDSAPSVRPSASGLVTEWDFGDGDAGYLSSVTHSYDTDGAFTVTLRLKHSAYPGVESTAVKIVDIVAVTEPPGPTPAPTPQPTPGEPSGLILINDRHFRSTMPKYGTITGDNPKYPDPSWVAMNEGWTATEGSRQFAVGPLPPGYPPPPSGDGMVGIMRYPPGMRSGVGPGAATLYAPPGMREVYIAIWAMVSRNKVANRANINKQCFFGVQLGNAQLILVAYGRELGKLRPQMMHQGIIDPRPNTSGEFAPKIAVEFKRAQWQRWELLIKMHSAARKADGMLDFFADGQHVQSWRNVDFNLGSEPDRVPAFSTVNWNPTHGGGGPGISYNKTEYQWDPANPMTLTRSREYILDMSLRPVSQRPQTEPEKDYPTPVPEFEIEADEAEYQWFDRFYVSGR